MDITQPISQPIASEFSFPMSFAIVGSVIPGLIRRYSVRTVNYPDLSSAVLHRVKAIDPVKKFPEMQGTHEKGNPLMDKLKQMLQSSGQAQMQPGYARLKEDLSWRGRSAEQN